MEENLGQPIAYGRTAEIYAWRNGLVLKLFYDWVGSEAVRYEQRVNQAIHASGLPVPSVGEIINIKDRQGLIYERIDGVPMWERLGHKPWNVFRYARRMAELHAEMHNSTVKADIPRQHQRISHKINDANALPDVLSDKALRELASLPEGDRLCHGDFHPANILVTGQSETLIDWVDASLGNPLADLARTTILLKGACETTQISNPIEKFFIRIMHARYIQHYFSIRPGGEAEYARWLPIVAAARLNENIPELEGWLIAQAEAD